MVGGSSSPGAKEARVQASYLHRWMLPSEKPTENIVTETTFKVSIVSHRDDHRKHQGAPGDLVVARRTPSEVATGS